MDERDLEQKKQSRYTVEDILREVRSKQGDAGAGASKYTVDELIRQYKKEQEGDGPGRQEAPAAAETQEDGGPPPRREETLDEIVRIGLKRYETTVKVDSEELSKTKKYRETRSKKSWQGAAEPGRAQAPSSGPRKIVVSEDIDEARYDEASMREIGEIFNDLRSLGEDDGAGRAKKSDLSKTQVFSLSMFGRKKPPADEIDPQLYYADKELRRKAMTELFQTKEVQTQKILAQQKKLMEIRENVERRIEGEEERVEERPSAKKTVDSIEDYTSPDDAEYFKEDMKNLHISLMVRLLITLICLLVSLASCLAPLFSGLPLVEQMDPELVYGAGVVAGALAVLANLSTVFSGLAGIVTFRADANSMASLGILGTLIPSAVLLFTVQDFGSRTYLGFAALGVAGLVLNLAGKLSLIRRVRRNFSFVCSPSPKYAVNPVRDEKLVQSLEGRVPGAQGMFVHRKRTDFLTRFMEYSYAEDRSDKQCRVLAPVTVLIMAAAALFVWFMEGDLPLTLTTIGVAAAICAPLSVMLCCNLPLGAAGKKLLKSGGMLAGYDTVQNFSDAGALIVDARDLFPQGAVEMKSLRHFGEQPLDRAVLDATGVACSTDSTLNDVFQRVFETKSDEVREADAVIYEDGAGLVGWVENRRVMIGNRDLMVSHSVQPPEQAVEDAVRESGLEVLYLAVAGELVAMFSLSYEAGEEAKAAVQQAVKRGVAIAVTSKDPNITKELLAKKLGVPEDMVGVLEKDEADRAEAENQLGESDGASLACTGKLSAFTAAIAAVRRVRARVATATAVQMFWAVLSLALTGCLAGLSLIHLVTMPMLLIYQGFWLLLVWLLPKLRR